ncbi:hypothetical protein [Trinickia acidisoli]|uniref:hypothetical protein n=1 Tax=Trinickia acidisoli TaxID=2767482 RepID=UPI001A900640|nr:hypothetical protein [Trinickia acidisoli]
MKSFLLNRCSILDMRITLIFQLQQETLPSREEHFGDLWKVAKRFEQLGLPLDKWYRPARTPKKSLANRAFDRTGPTPVAPDMLRAQDERNRTTNHRITAIWTSVATRKHLNHLPET